MKIICPQCGAACDKFPGAVNRAVAKGLRIYCGRRCAGLGRRKPKLSVIDQKTKKSAYDAERREKNRSALLAKKRESFKRNYDPKKAAEYRKKRMSYHVQYCRRVEYRERKSEYDLQRRMKKDFGPFWQAALVLRDLETEVAERATRYEIGRTNGTTNKAQERRRDYERLVSNNP